MARHDGLVQLGRIIFRPNQKTDFDQHPNDGPMIKTKDRQPFQLSLKLRTIRQRFPLPPGQMAKLLIITPFQKLAIGHVFQIFRSRLTSLPTPNHRDQIGRLSFGNVTEISRIIF